MDMKEMLEELWKASLEYETAEWDWQNRSQISLSFKMSKSIF